MFAPSPVKDVAVTPASKVTLLLALSAIAGFVFELAVCSISCTLIFDILFNFKI